jgi:predicted lipoprotein with Yx(FWY)xxD motif
MGAHKALNGNFSGTMVLLALALAVAGCGSNGGSSGTDTTAREKPAATPSEKEPPIPGTAVSTGTPKSSRWVVSEVGFTLYHFDKDKRNSGKTACYGGCAKLWEPYLTRAKPTVMLKARASMLGTIKRKDGTAQVTYGGWPLYVYTPDGAGLAGGYERKSFGGVWYPIDPSGEVVR